MYSNLISRITLASALIVVAALPLNAQAPAVASPTITFAQANNGVVSVTKGDLVAIRASVSDVNGLQVATLSGAGRNSSSVFSTGINSATLELYWSTAHAKPGSTVKFTSTASNVAGKGTTASITIHVVK